MTTSPVERPLRLATGLVMVTYVVSHFLTHAAGLLLLPRMEAAREVLLWPWRALPGQALLAASVLTHGSLGLWALFRRRHLRMPANEAWQLGLGLTIPILLLQHGLAGLVSEAITGAPFTYPRAIYQYWVRSPEVQLTRQVALLLIVWLHACLGLHAWLRLKAWFHRWSAPLGALALLLPTLALAGIVNAGWDVERRLAAEPDFLARHGPPPAGTAEAAARARLAALGEGTRNVYLLLLAGVVLLRQGRNWIERRACGLRITYPDGRQVSVPRGFSVLEASRAAGIAHASVCGGRGRCSTCRVRVGAGLADLPPPNPTEAAVLARLKAPPSVRLACQLRPTADLAVVPLVHPTGARAGDGFAAGTGGGQELFTTAMFVDLRGSTALASGRLPFDALFIVDRYVQVVSQAVRRHGGQVTSVAGDGVMSVFWDEADPGRAAVAALAAAAAVWDGIDRASGELAADLDGPLRFGIGIHSGLAVVGSAVGPAEAALQFVGDVGNLAARLEEACKDLGVSLIVSRATWTLAGRQPGHGVETISADIRGCTESLPVVVIRQRRELAG